MSALQDASADRSWVHEGLESFLATYGSDLVDVRRHLHAHPELSFDEHRTTALLVQRLRAAGLRPRVLPTGTGVVVDIGAASGPTQESADRTVVLRADIDALPLQDSKDVPYRSTTDGVCHACGHDVHTAVVLGAALALARHPGLPGRVRCLFQPAEERIPGGALRVLESGEMDGVDGVLALHCDPALEVGEVGLRVGSLTAACDAIELVLSGPGGHTSRPHLTVDLVGAAARVISDVPALLQRHLDPRAGASLVWGAVHAGRAVNAIPAEARIGGTLRILDHSGWSQAEPIVRALLHDVVRPTGADLTIDYRRGVPPVVNDADLVGVLRAAVVETVGESAVAETPQSLGGEDFGWYGERSPVAMARLGVHRSGRRVDLHQPGFDVDEDAIGVGVRVLVAAALRALVR